MAGSLLWQGQSKERSEVLEGITAFQYLSLEHRAFLTWINSDENRRSVRKGDKHVYLWFTVRLLVISCKPFGKQESGSKFKIGHQER